MPDPLTITAALSLAGKAIGGIQKAVNSGRELESCMGHISRWFECVADVNKARERAKNPPLFKKITNAKSIESEAIEALMAQRKLHDQRKQLRELIMYSWGKDAWEDLLNHEKRIRQERAKAIHRQVEFKRQLIDFIAIATLSVLLIGIIAGTLWLFRQGGH
mgnify:CR=1 FL=1